MSPYTGLVRPFLPPRLKFNPAAGIWPPGKLSGLPRMLCLFLSSRCPTPPSSRIFHHHALPAQTHSLLECSRLLFFRRWVKNDFRSHLAENCLWRCDRCTVCAGQTVQRHGGGVCELTDRKDGEGGEGAPSAPTDAVTKWIPIVDASCAHPICTAQ